MFSVWFSAVSAFEDGLTVLSSSGDIFKASEGRLALLTEVFPGGTNYAVKQGRDCGANCVPRPDDDTRRRSPVSICSRLMWRADLARRILWYRSARSLSEAGPKNKKTAELWRLFQFFSVSRYTKIRCVSQAKNAAAPIGRGAAAQAPTVRAKLSISRFNNLATPKNSKAPDESGASCKSVEARD
jgi:hypothetical protein